MKDFGAIYGEHWELVFGFLLRLCRDPLLAEELAQETFYQAMRSWKAFRGESSVATWLCAIAKRLYYISLRRAQCLPLEEAPPANTPDPAEQMLLGDRRMMVQRVLHHLPEPYKEVFTLRTLCDLSHGEIGDLFSKSANWARVTYYRARLLLQEALKEEEE